MPASQGTLAPLASLPALGGKTALFAAIAEVVPSLGHANVKADIEATIAKQNALVGRRPRVVCEERATLRGAAIARSLHRPDSGQELSASIASPDSGAATAVCLARQARTAN